MFEIHIDKHMFPLYNQINETNVRIICSKK